MNFPNSFNGTNQSDPIMNQYDISPLLVFLWENEIRKLELRPLNLNLVEVVIWFHDSGIRVGGGGAVTDR